MNNIVFNYFAEMFWLIKNIDLQQSTLHKQATQNLYFIILIALGQSEVYIVEGEFDVLAMHQTGIKNTISIPNSFNDNDDFWINSEKYLQDIEKFYICTDNDDKGEAVSEKIVQRLK